MRFQQVTGAVMAKGVEDTAYYRYTRFIALNEVGGDPAQFGASPEHLPCRAGTAAGHAAAQHDDAVDARHEARRGRARTARRAERAARRVGAARARPRWSAVPIADATFGYLLWQTFAGAGLIERDRMHAYAEKAMREAAQRTTWIDPDEAFERAVHEAVDRAYDDDAVREPLGRVHRPDHAVRLDELARAEARAADDARRARTSTRAPSSGRTRSSTPTTGVRSTSSCRRTMLDAARRRARAAADRRGRRGQAVGRLARAAAAARLAGPVRVLHAAACARSGRATHAVAFDRGGAITVATRLPVGLERAGGWGDTTLDLGRRGDRRDLRAPRRRARSRWPTCSAEYPVALLVR